MSRPKRKVYSIPVFVRKLVEVRVSGNVEVILEEGEDLKTALRKLQKTEAKHVDVDNLEWDDHPADFAEIVEDGNERPHGNIELRHELSDIVDNPEDYLSE